MFVWGWHIPRGDKLGINQLHSQTEKTTVEFVIRWWLPIGHSGSTSTFSKRHTECRRAVEKIKCNSRECRQNRFQKPAVYTSSGEMSVREPIERNFVFKRKTELSSSHRLHSFIRNIIPVGNFDFNLLLLVFFHSLARPLFLLDLIEINSFHLQSSQEKVDGNLGHRKSLFSTNP